MTMGYYSMEYKFKNIESAMVYLHKRMEIQACTSLVPDF